uniref:Uncharacterized protein n=1 Tax=Grammatophora oceanica TaxID=210454 RepID=A0A7S1UNC7_9STRA
MKKGNNFYKRWRLLLLGKDTSRRTITVTRRHANAAAGVGTIHSFQITTDLILHTRTGLVVSRMAHSASGSMTRLSLIATSTRTRGGCYKWIWSAADNDVESIVHGYTY